MRSWRRLIGLLGMIGLFAGRAVAQQDRGELQIDVHDPQGAALATAGELVSEGNQFHLKFQVGDDGRYVAKDLAFGVYRVSLTLGDFLLLLNWLRSGRWCLSY